MPLFDSNLTTLNLRDGKSVEKRWNLNSPATPLTAVNAWNDMGGGITASGEIITEQNAMSISTVYTCVTILAEAAAGLPCHLIRRTEAGNVPATDHTLWPLLVDDPNPEMTAFTFWSTMVGSSALTGNAYAQIIRDPSGEVESIWPLHPFKTEPVRNATGVLAYKTTDGMKDGAYRIIASSDVLHFPLFSLDGIKGISPITSARETFAMAKAMEKFGARWFANGAQPSSILINKGTSKPDAKAQAEFREAWNAAHSGSNQHKQGILWGEWDVKTIGLSPEDSQFLLARNYTRSDIGAMFKIPAHMLGSLEKLSNNNYIGQQQGYVTDTLRPITMRIEAELKRKLLKSPKFFVKFDESERLRGDFATKMQAISLGRAWAVLTGNEARAMLGFAPIGEQGDVLLSPGNMENAQTLLTANLLHDKPLPEIEDDEN